MAAWTYRRSGSVVSSSSAASISPSPGTHNSDYFTGDLLILAAIDRAPAESIAAPAGWEPWIAYTTQGSIEVWGRFADGTADDSPAVDWSGSSQVCAWIDVLYNGGYGTLASIVHANNTESASTGTVPPCPALTNASNGFTEDDCLLYAVGKRSTTADSVTAVTAPSGMTLAQSFIDNSFGFVAGSAYVQQTTQTDFGGANFGATGGTESSSATGVILALLTSVSGLVKKLKVLAVSAAQSDASIEGEVFEAPSGGEITGPKIGYFSGAAFEGTLESGEAVLKVPVTDFGGSALTTSDTPVVLVRNTTDTTGLIAATVIEE